MKIWIALLVVIIIALTFALLGRKKEAENMSRIRRGVGADGGQEIPVASGIITSYIDPDYTYTYFDGVNEQSCDLCPNKETCPTCPEYKYAIGSVVSDMADTYSRRTNYVIKGVDKDSNNRGNISYSNLSTKGANSKEKFSQTGPKYVGYDVIHYGDEEFDRNNIADLPGASGKQPEEIIFGDATKDLYKHIGKNECVHVEYKPACGGDVDYCGKDKFVAKQIIIDTPVSNKFGPDTDNEPQTGPGSNTTTVSIKPGSVNTAISAFVPEMAYGKISKYGSYRPKNERYRGPSQHKDNFLTEPMEEDFVGGNMIKMTIKEAEQEKSPKCGNSVNSRPDSTTLGNIPQRPSKGSPVYNCGPVYNEFNQKVQSELYNEILGLDYASAPTPEDCEYYNSQNNYIYKEPCGFL